MPAPYDYNIQVANPIQSAVQGLQLGSAISEARKQQEDAARQKLLSERVMSVMDKPVKTASDFVGLAMLLPPQQAESMRKNWETLDSEQQKNNIGQMSEVMAALQNGRGDIAAQRLRDGAEAARNSGDEKRAKIMEMHAQIAEKDPRFALTNIGFTMAALPGGKDALEGIDKMLSTQREEAKAPYDLTEAQAKAQKAAVDAKFSDSNAVLDLQKKGWDITKIQSDIGIARENSRIAAMNADLSREGNDLKKQELQQKIDAATQKRDDAVRTTAATVESSRTATDNTLNTIDAILKSPALTDVVGPIEGKKYYPSTVAGMLNPFSSSSEDRADVLAKIDTLTSQITLQQLSNLKTSSANGSSGMGALSDREGEILANGLQSLRTTQSEKGFRNSAKEVQRLLLKARANMATKYGVPDAVPDTPNAIPEPDEIDALLKKYGQ